MSHAAASGQVGATTIARRIDALEGQLTIRLFHRRQTGYVLTQAGRRLLPLAERMAADAAFLQRRASDEDGSRPVVRLELPELLASALIVPGLSAGGTNGIELEIGARAASTRLSLRAADIVLRLGRPDHGDYAARRVGALDRGIFGSPGYLDANTERLETSRLDALDLVGWTDDMSHLPIARWFAKLTGGRSPVVRAQTLQLQTDAIAAGFGIGAVPKIVAEGQGLRRVGDEMMSSEIWLLRRTDTENAEAVGMVARRIEEIVTDARLRLCFIGDDTNDRRTTS